MPTLLLINGPAGIGKSTIAQRYIDDHPLALLLSTDHLIASMGQWLSHEEEGWKLAFSLLITMADQHLATGHDVVVPHLLLDTQDAQVLEQVALKHDAHYFECALLAPKGESVERMFERGTWGEPGAPPLTNEDTPIIEDKFVTMQHILEQRPKAVHIRSVKDNIEHTYTELKSALRKSYTK